MTPGPDPREIMERNVEMALEMRARQDPESVPLVALRQMRQELNDLQGQRRVRTLSSATGSRRSCTRRPTRLFDGELPGVPASAAGADCA
jgi:hypothetical protein